MKKFIHFILELCSRFIALFALPQPDMVDNEYDEMIAMLKDGDILASRTDWELSNVFMPGYWKHVGVYCNGHIYEAVTSGVRKTSVAEFFYKKDHIGLCRFDKSKHSIDSLEKYMDDGRSWLESKIGKKYDWKFDEKDQTKIYCSEYAYFFLVIVYGDDFEKSFVQSSYMGDYFIRPTDVWNNLTQIKKWE